MLLLVCHKLLAPSRWIFLLDDKIFLPRLSRESDSEEKEEKHKTKHSNGDLEKPNRRWEKPRTELPLQGTSAPAPAHAHEAPSPNPSDRHTHGHAHPPHQHSHNPAPTSTSKEPEPNPTTSSSRALLNAIQARAVNRARRVRIFNFRPGTNSKLEKDFGRFKYMHRSYIGSIGCIGPGTTGEWTLRNHIVDCQMYLSNQSLSQKDVPQKINRKMAKRWIKTSWNLKTSSQSSEMR